MRPVHEERLPGDIIRLDDKGFVVLLSLTNTPLHQVSRVNRSTWYHPRGSLIHPDFVHILDHSTGSVVLDILQDYDLRNAEGSFHITYSEHISEPSAMRSYD